MAEEKGKKKTSRQTTDERSYTRLYRSETDKIIAGVAGGLGRYFTVDPVLVRIIFILLTLFHGSGILIYLILWIILPRESQLDNQTITHESVKRNLHEMRDHMKNFASNFHTDEKNNTRMAIAGIIIILGIIFLLDNFGLGDWFDLGRLWPIILIAVGIAMIF